MCTFPRGFAVADHRVKSSVAAVAAAVSDRETLVVLFVDAVEDTRR